MIIQIDVLTDEYDGASDSVRIVDEMKKAARARGGDLRHMKWSWHRRIDLVGNPWQCIMLCNISKEMG